MAVACRYPRHGAQQGVVDGAVPDLDRGERRRRPAHRTAGGADPAGRARDGAWSMLRQDAELVLAGQFRMRGDDGAPVKDRDAAGAAQDLINERSCSRLAMSFHRLSPRAARVAGQLRALAAEVHK